MTASEQGVRGFLHHAPRRQWVTHEAPALFTDRATIERRLEHYVSALRLDRDRTLAWAFSQAVLSIVWSIEDGEPVSATGPAMALADRLASMLPKQACSAPELDSRGCGA